MDAAKAAGCDCAHHGSDSRLARLLPAVACAFCPACLPLWTGALSALGLGAASTLTEAHHGSLLAVSLTIALGFGLRDALRRGRWWSFGGTAVGCALLVAGHLLEQSWCELLGMAVLIGQAVVGHLLHRRRHAH